VQDAPDGCLNFWPGVADVGETEGASSYAVSDESGFRSTHAYCILSTNRESVNLRPLQKPFRR
jgi:hypothetical protein